MALNSHKLAIYQLQIFGTTLVLLTGYGDSQGPAASDGAMEGGAGFCGG